MKKILTFSLLFFLTPYFAYSLTLTELEQTAVNMAPELSELRYNEQALREQAVAARQLPDPRLQAGIINVPTDTFSLTQENMTQVKFGVAQFFPKGHSLSIKSEQKQLLAQAEQFRSLTMKTDILRIVRNHWLDIYYWQQASQIIEDTRTIFQQLVRVTESMLAAGKTNQYDVLRAQLELSHIENRQLMIAEQLAIVQAQLGRWVGIEMAEQVHPEKLPIWPALTDKKSLQATITQHPQLQTDASLIAASSQTVELAKQEYKPGLTVDVSYSFRQGNNPATGGRRADFIGAQVFIDLPIFTAKRQDKQLAASIAELDAARDEELADYRKLHSELLATWASWKQQGQQAALYQAQLIPEAKQYAQATLTAYQNDQSDFPTVARAYVAELNTQLEGLKIKVEQSKSHVSLLYLSGNDL